MTAEPLSGGPEIRFVAPLPLSTLSVLQRGRKTPTPYLSLPRVCREEGLPRFAPKTDAAVVRSPPETDRGGR